MPDVEVIIEGSDKLRQAMDNEQLTAPAIRKMMYHIAILLRRGAKERSPVDTGKLLASLTYMVDSRPLPRFAIVSTDRLSPRGFPYPRALEDSPRYHYRRTARQGLPTKGWFSGTIEAQMDRIVLTVVRALEEIGERWERGGK